MLQPKLVLFPAHGRAPPCLQHACAAAREPAANRSEWRAAPALLSEHIPVSARLPAAYWCCGARRLQRGRLYEWISKDPSKAGSSTCGVCCGKGWVIQLSTTGEPQIRAKQVLWPFRIKKKKKIERCQLLSWLMLLLRAVLLLAFVSFCSHIVTATKIVNRLPWAAVSHKMAVGRVRGCVLLLSVLFVEHF